MIDNQFIKKPSGFNKQRLDSFVRSVKTNKQDVQKKELDEALELHTQLMAQDMMQKAMQLPPFPVLQQAYMNQGMQQMPQAAYGMEIGAVMPSINTPFTYPSQQNITPPNSDMFKKNADAYEGKGMSAFKNLFTTAANAVLNPAIQEYNQKVYNAKQKAAADEEETDLPQEKLGGLIKAQKGLTWAEYLKKRGITDKDMLALTQEQVDGRLKDIKKQEAVNGQYDIKNDIYNSTLASLVDDYNKIYPLAEDGSRSTIQNAMSDFYVNNGYKDYGLTQKEAEDLYRKQSIDPALNQKYIDAYFNSRNKYNSQKLEDKGDGYRDVPVEWVDAYPKQTLKGIENTNTEFPGELRRDAGNMFRMPVLYDDQILGQQDIPLLAADWMRDYYKMAPGTEGYHDRPSRDDHTNPAIYPKPNYSVTGVNPAMQTYQYKDEYGNIVTGEQPAVSMQDSQNLGDNQYYDYNTGPWVKNYNNKMKLYDITQQNLARLGQYDPDYRIQSTPLTEDDRRVAGYENQYINDPTVGFYQEFENEDPAKKPCKDCGTLQGSTVSADADNYYQTYGVQYPSKGVLSKKDLDKLNEGYYLIPSGNPGVAVLNYRKNAGNGKYISNVLGPVHARDFLNDEQQAEFFGPKGGTTTVDYDPNTSDIKIYPDMHSAWKVIDDERGVKPRVEAMQQKQMNQVEAQKAAQEQWEKEQREKQQKRITQPKTIQAPPGFAMGGETDPKVEFHSRSKSGNGDYVVNQTLYSDGTTKSKVRRSLKGFITGAPKKDFTYSEPEEENPSFAQGGSLIKAQTTGDIGKALQDAYNQAMANLQSDQPVYNEAGDLLTKEQLQQAASDAYNRYYQGIGQAYKDNPTPNWGGADFSYLNQYPTMPSLEMPGYNLSGQGIAPELYKGVAAAQMNTNMQADYPGLGRYFGLSPQKNLELGDVNYSSNYKEMYNDALRRGEYDRFETNIEANPTLAGKALDKMGIGKLFSTRNYDITQNILPRGESVLDPERLAETQRKQTLLKNANSPAGGLFETDQITPDLWQNISRRQRRELLNEADIDPNRKNLRGLGRKFLGNEAAEIAAERGPAPRPNGINIPGMVMPVDISGIQTEEQTPTPSITKLPSASAPKGSNPVVPAPPVTGPTNTVVTPPVTPTQPTAAYAPPAFDLGRTQNQIVKTEADWFGTKPAGLALPDNYDKDWRNYAVDKSAGPFMYPDANKVGQDWNAAMAKDPKKKAMWESFNDMPAPIREIAADQVFNAGYDPRVMVLGAAGVDKGYTGKGSPVISNPEYRSWLKTNADQLWKDNKALINQQYADDPQAFTSSITDNRKIIYKNLRTGDLPGGVRTDFPSNSGGPGTQYNAWSGRSGAVQDYVDQTYFDPSTGYTAPQYFKQRGGSQLPSFKGEYGPSTFGVPNPFGISPNWFNNFDLALGLKTDNPLMAGTQDDVLNYNGFDYTKNGLPSGYIGANEDNSSLATATGKGKLTGNIAPTTYLTIGNTAGKFLADNVFGRDERKNAEKQYRKSRFLENNLALTSADTQFDPRLRGFDRATDAFGGAPYAGAQVQYGQPLIAMAQQGTQIPMTMQEGGVYTLTPEMIKQIIDNGGEIEYVDNSNNFVNPFNQ